MIKIIGGKIIRDNKFSILRVNNSVLKIPLTAAAYKEMKGEKKPLPLVKKDKHFSNYLLDYKFFFGLQLTPHLTPLISHPNRFRLIRDYFALAFKNSSEWEWKKLKDLINSTYYLQFVSKYFSKDIGLWENFLNTVKMPQSSVHGDFTPDNILVNGDRLFFIDWIRYRISASRYFDLFNYYLFLNKYKDIPWIEIWKREFNLNKSNLFGIEIKKKYFLAYGVWQVSEELKMLKMRNELKPYKIRKYTNFIKIVTKFIQENYDN